MEPTVRFWNKVERTDDCWLWRAATAWNGYGLFRLGNKMVLVHRYSWSLANGPIPDGRVIDHLCHVRACVNPAHLACVSMQENVQRRRT
jgi:HNH endonuclease